MRWSCYGRIEKQNKKEQQANKQRLTTKKNLHPNPLPPQKKKKKKKKMTKNKTKKARKELEKKKPNKEQINTNSNLFQAFFTWS